MVFLLLLRTISIFQRPLSKSPPRIQRFLLRLQRYNFQLNHVPGNQLFVVYMLSYFVYSVIKSCKISEDRLQQIITETQKGDISQSFTLQIQNR